MARELVKLVERYHQALNAFDFAAVEAMFAEDAEYHSSGIGGLYGRKNIIYAMKVYFSEFSDQVSVDDSMALFGENSVRSHWRLSATTKSSGRRVRRQGTETIYFDSDNLISVVEVEDVEPVEE